MSRVFISYSHKDVDVVRAVNDYLQSRRILTWFDEKSIEAGDKWQINIATSIYSCDVFLLFNSKNYSESEYCKKEFNYAKERNANTTIIIVDLDGSRNSFWDTDITNYQQIVFSDNDIDGLCRKLFANADIARCSMVDRDIKHVGDGTGFLNVLSKMNNPVHYAMLEPFINFLSEVSDNEKKGVYISEKANFSSFSAFRTNTVEWDFCLVGEDDYTDDIEKSANLTFAKNVLYALFKFANVQYSPTLSDTLEFAKPFKYANHRFSRFNAANDGAVNDSSRNYIDERVYEYLNSLIENAYETCDSIDSLIEKLYDACQASKFFETQEAQFSYIRELAYDVTPSVVHVARLLFALQNKDENVCAECIPDIVKDDSNELVGCQSLIDSNDKDVFLHVRYGCGITSLLKTWFKQDGASLYIDLGNLAYKGKDAIKNYIGGRSSYAYRLSFLDLFNYSAFKNKITLLIDNLDALSQSDRQRVISELNDLKGVFRIVLPSTNVNADGKLSLTADFDSFSDYEKYSVLPLKKKHIVAYVAYKLEEKGINPDSILSQFAELDDNDKFFEIFDNFTKINLLLDSIGDGRNFSIYDVKEEFDSKITVYKKLFESDSVYSIPKKIALMFKDNVVNIEDVILKLVWNEIDNLKKTSYTLRGIDKEIPVDDNSLRFRDFYPMLNKITGKYYFLNDDVRSYFSASYVYEKISQRRSDKEYIQNILKPLENDYHVFKYLKEFDLLSIVDLDDMLGDKEYESTALILYKILQYYGSGPIKTEFLSKARFEKLPDKFFFGAENVKKISVPPCVKEVGRAVFANNVELEELDFDPRTRNAVKASELTIKPWAIINCPKLKQIKLGDNYLKYNHPLASRCYGLKKIVVSAQNPSFSTLYNGAMLVSKDNKHLYFATNALEGEVKIPDCIEVLETNSLSYLKNVEKYVIPKSVKQSDTNFSDFCDNLTFLSVEEGNDVFYSDENGYMYCDAKNGKTLFRVPSGVKNDVIIPDDVTTIGSDSISCCMFTPRVVVPSSVKYIENYAFADTYSLKKLEFEDIEGVEEIENYIFLSTNEDLKIYAPEPMSLKKFNETYCRHLSKDKVRGRMTRRITFADFEKRGIEVIRENDLDRDFDNIVVARDITLFNKAQYEPNDLNIMIVGMTEYNAIMAKNPVSANEYVNDLIKKNHIKAVLFSRDLPLLAQFEGDANNDVAVMRTSKSSTGATRIISDIIKEIGG